MKCLLCHHEEITHVAIPPNDRISRKEARYFLKLASTAHSEHVSRSANAKERFTRSFNFKNRPCTVGAVERLCPCLDFYATRRSLAAFKKAEAEAYVKDRRDANPEALARTAMNTELKAMERATQERWD